MKRFTFDLAAAGKRLTAILRECGRECFGHRVSSIESPASSLEHEECAPATIRHPPASFESLGVFLLTARITGAFDRRGRGLRRCRQRHARSGPPWVSRHAASSSSTPDCRGACVLASVPGGRQNARSSGRTVTDSLSRRCGTSNHAGCRRIWWCGWGSVSLGCGGATVSGWRVVGLFGRGGALLAG